MSRDKFESWWRGAREVPSTEHAAYEAWLAGRESMRDEAAEILASVDSYANPLTANDCEEAIRNIEP